MDSDAGIKVAERREEEEKDNAEAQRNAEEVLRLADSPWAGYIVPLRGGFLGSWCGPGVGGAGGLEGEDGHEEGQN